MDTNSTNERARHSEPDSFVKDVLEWYEDMECILEMKDALSSQLAKRIYSRLRDKRQAQ